MITVIIPTYNRPECIEYIFQKCISHYEGSIFKFEIHDSSESNKTKEIFIQYKNSCKNISLKYFRYESSISSDDKAILAIKNVSEEFFWLIGDGNVVDFERLEPFLIKNELKKYDVLNLEAIHRIAHLGQDKNAIKNKIYNYNNQVLYAKKYFSHLTYWGSAIIKTDFLKINYQNKRMLKYQSEKIPWWIACLIFESCVKHSCVFLGTVYSTYVAYNPMKKDHGWTNGERYYDYTFKKFNRAIQLLPVEYRDIEIEIIDFFRRDALVSYSYLLNLRKNGTLSLNMIQKYKKDIEYIPGFYNRMRLIALIPIKIVSILICLKDKYKILKFKLFD